MLAVALRVIFQSTRLVQLVADIVGLAAVLIPLEPSFQWYLVFAAVVVTMLGDFLMDAFTRIPVAVWGAPGAPTILRVRSGLYAIPIGILFGLIGLVVLFGLFPMDALLVKLIVGAFFVYELLGDLQTQLLVS